VHLSEAGHNIALFVLMYSFIQYDQHLGILKLIKINLNMYSVRHNQVYFIITLLGLGARDGVVVEALRYKPEGRGFDSR
jgi:hypothetical protein